MKIATIIGARPQFVKAAVVSNSIKNKQSVTEVIIHTGQHYDINMSDVFFAELGIPLPTHNLNIGSGSHGDQTGRMMIRIEDVLKKENPDIVLLYGDTNSTVAGALVAAKLQIPIAHVEAGVRSFNRLMPEEINRVVTDHISTWLFCPTKVASKNLSKEGITVGVNNVGDVMYDCNLLFGQIAEKKSSILDDLDLQSSQYYLATIHRPENTDHPQRLREIFGALAKLDLPVLLPIHPRTKNILAKEKIVINDKVIRVVDPISYFDMVKLQKHATMILTDSGGIQKEAYFCKVPCITLRDETEWTELVDSGWNRIVGAESDRILSAVESFQTENLQPFQNLYGDGRAASKIIEMLISEY